jgi:hypothetical protein
MNRGGQPDLRDGRGGQRSSDLGRPGSLQPIGFGLLAAFSYGQGEAYSGLE